jgi:disulfide bond formation protein DsbB
MEDRSAKMLGIGINIFDLFGISLVLIAAFVFQVGLHELPCPLCLLQRLGLLGIAFGTLLNLRYGTRVIHYALSCLSAIFMGVVAARQIFLHIAPGDKGYGAAFLGYHMYTWSFIVAVAFILFTMLVLMIEKQFKPVALKLPAVEKHIINIIIGLIVLLALVNLFSVFFECGLNECPENPMKYLLFGFWQI